jgi:hypothetical protein
MCILQQECELCRPQQQQQQQQDKQQGICVKCQEDGCEFYVAPITFIARTSFIHSFIC